MSRKRKSLPQEEPKIVQSEMVSYRVFFHTCLANGTVKEWQEREIHAFFKDLGLQDKETSDTYKIALAKF